MLAQVSALALLGAIAVRAQNQTASAYDINLIEANFQNAQLVPQFLPSFTPQGTLSVSFGGQAITPGQNLATTAVASSPQLTVIPASGATRINSQSVYTVAMIDADIVGFNANTTAQTRHWLVNTVGFGSDGAVNYTGATSITDYAGPGPLPNSGTHRYVVMVYAQGSNFAPPSNLSTSGVPLGTMYWNQYVSSTGLGPLVAANYFDVSASGTDSVTVASTSAVNTATIATTTAASSASGASVSGTAIAGSATASGAASGGASASGSSASGSSSSKAAAGKVEPVNFGLGAVIGAVGVVATLLGASLGF